MSTFNGLIKEMEGVSVDRFDEENLSSRLFFLSHCHTDHYKGIESPEFFSYIKSNNYTVYSSDVSRIIITNRYPHLKRYVKALPIGDSHSIVIPEAGLNKEAIVDVTFIPAGHCPGSVMFLFFTSDGKTVLYTGDFRMMLKDLQNIKPLRRRNKPIDIDKLYLDTTFWHEEYSYLPSREESCELICQIIRYWLSQGDKNVVNLVIPAHIGAEFLFMDIYTKFNIPICISDFNDYLIRSHRQVAELQNVFTLDEKSTRIRSSSRSIKSSNMCNIRVSALRWNKLNADSELYEKRNDQQYFVCYSSHCSYKELQDFLRYLKPKALEACVVPKEKSEEQRLYQTLNEFCKNFLLVPCDVLHNQSQKIKGPKKNKPKHISNHFYSSDSDEENVRKQPKLSK